MRPDTAEKEGATARAVIALLARGRREQGIKKLRRMKETLYASILPRQRQSRGIVWVLQRITRLMVSACSGPEQVWVIAEDLYRGLSPDDKLLGIPIFLMAEYGKTDPTRVLDFFQLAADSQAWETREYAATGVHKLVGPCREVVLPWLKALARSDSPRLRRLVSESLRPVTENQWLNDEPQVALDILRLLFREAHPYPRSSVGNNLSDMARRNPQLILGVVKELVESGDKNSAWIAHRACRNLVKRDPQLILDLLRVDEYHYKDRHFHRGR